MKRTVKSLGVAASLLGKILGENVSKCSFTLEVKADIKLVIFN